APPSASRTSSTSRASSTSSESSASRTGQRALAPPSAGPPRPERPASGSAPSTEDPTGHEILYALGLGDRVCGVTHECDGWHGSSGTTRSTAVRTGLSLWPGARTPTSFPHQTAKTVSDNFQRTS